ncbi:MAG: hypothetical protein ACJ8AD_08785 [Gemmatimonadaceae bacterium]
MELELRALMPDDAGAARALVSEQFAGTRYRVRALELLESALRFDDPEHMALLAFANGGERLVGLALFGTVTGAHAVVKVHGVVARELETAVALLDAVRQASERSGERMIVSELPDDAPFAVASKALAASGFAEEGRVPDFVRDGVALRLFVRPLLTA